MLETAPQPKYLLLTFGEYFKLNHDLSVAKGWQLEQPTERSREMNPKAAKVNITYDGEGNETGYEVRLVMRISSKEQENYPELIQGYELHDDYTPVDISVSQIVALGLSAEVIDWTLLHYLKVGHVEDGLILWLEEEARSQLSDEAVELLNNKGVTIITVE